MFHLLGKAECSESRTNTAKFRVFTNTVCEDQHQIPHLCWCGIFWAHSMPNPRNFLQIHLLTNCSLWKLPWNLSQVVQTVTFQCAHVTSHTWVTKLLHFLGHQHHQMLWKTGHTTGKCNIFLISNITLFFLNHPNAEGTFHTSKIWDTALGPRSTFSLCTFLTFGQQNKFKR